MVLVEDMTNNYPIAVANTPEKGIELAKLYVKKMFEDFDKATYQLQSNYPKDIRKRNLIGISISDIDVNNLDLDCRTNYFWGHIKKDGTIVDKNKVI